MNQLVAWVLLLFMAWLGLIAGARYVRVIRYHRRHDYMAATVCGLMVVGIVIIFPFITK